MHDTANQINRPVRLHRHRPLALGFARFILTGLTQPVHTAGGPTYQAARLVVITSSHVEVLQPLLGESFRAGHQWQLHTTLVLADGEPVIDLIRVHSPLARTLRRHVNAPDVPRVAASTA